MARFLFIDINGESNIILCEKKKESLKILKTLKLKKEQLSRIKAERDLGLYSFKAPLCYISLPVSMLGFRIIELPFREEEKIREILPFELKEKVTEPVEDLVYDFIKITQDKEAHQKILAVYTKKKEIISLLKDLSSIGIEPEIIGSLSLRYIIEKGLKIEDLLDPPDHEEALPELLRKEIEKTAINLLRNGLFMEKTSLLKRLKIMDVLLISILLVLTLSFVISIRRSYSEASKVKTFIEGEYRKEFPHESIKDPLLQLKSRLREMKEKKDLLTGIPQVETLTKIKPSQGIIIESLEIDTKGITIRGESRDLAGIELFREKLGENFRNPSIIESNQFSDKFRFTIKAER